MSMQVKRGNSDSIASKCQQQQMQMRPVCEIKTDLESRQLFERCLWCQHNDKHNERMSNNVPTME